MTSQIEDALANLTTSNTVVENHKVAQNSPITIPNEVYLIFYHVEGETPRYVDAVFHTWESAMAYSGLKVGLNLPTSQQCVQGSGKEDEWALVSTDGNAECIVERYIVNNDGGATDPNKVFLVLAVQSGPMNTGFVFWAVGFVVVRVYSNYWRAEDSLQECREEVEAAAGWKNVFMKVMRFDVR